jgi:hypothetical protein
MHRSSTSKNNKKHNSTATLYTNEHIYEYPNVATSEECDRIISLAKEKGMSQDRHLDGKYLQSREHTYNPSLTEQVWLDTTKDIMFTLNDRISTILHRSLLHQPPFEIIKYTRSTEPSDPHHDTYDKAYLQHYHVKQRFATMVLFLNDDYQGGETYFPLLDKVIYPKKGTLLFFYNVHSNMTTRNTSLHHSYSITHGEKWVAHRCITL